MKKMILTILLSTCYWGAMQACSVCGCSASNQYLGILPQSGNSFVGVQYQFRKFQSDHSANMEEMTVTNPNDYYHTVQVWGRYTLLDRFQLFAFVPYVVNERIEGDSYKQTKGLGDITLMANYRLIKTDSANKMLKHNLLVGGGVKLPTGRYNRNDIRYKDGMPNMQPGTSSFDFTINTNYTIQLKNIGLNTDFSYVITTPNKEQYKFGNRFGGALTLFHSTIIRSLLVIPQAGIKYEHISADFDNYYYSIRNNTSGGHMLFTSVGVQVFYKKVGTQVLFHMPVAQHYADGMVKNTMKAEGGIYVLF